MFTKSILNTKKKVFRNKKYFKYKINICTYSFKRVFKIRKSERKK